MISKKFRITWEDIEFKKREFGSPSLNFKNFAKKGMQFIQDRFFD